MAQALPTAPPRYVETPECELAATDGRRRSVIHQRAWLHQGAQEEGPTQKKGKPRLDDAAARCWVVMGVLL